MTNLRALFIVTAVALIFTTGLAIADDSNYQRLSLKEGISIEVPSHWFIHSETEKKNFAAASEASTRAAGIDYDTTENTSRLLAISALPMPTGAKIRISVVRPLRFSGEDLRAATAKDLKESKVELTEEMTKALPATGCKLLSLEMPRVETINSQFALLIEYRRTDAREPYSWTVKRYRIPFGDKLIELTMSYRESDAPILKPILDHVKRSLRF